MAKALYEALQMDMPALAEMLRRKGRGRDTVLAHITPKEAELLKKRGGSGTINPDTGLPQFDDGIDYVGTVGTPDVGPPVSAAPPEIQRAYSGEQTAGFLIPPTPPFDSGETQTAPITQPNYNAPTITPATSANPYDVQDIAAGQYAGAVPTGQPVTGGIYGASGATAYAPQTLTPAQLDQLAVGQNPLPAPDQATKPDQSTLDKLNKALQDPGTLAKLGLGLGGVLYAGTLGQKSAAQGQAAVNQISSVGAPYQTTGQALQAQAQQGQLSPASQQAYQAAQAQINQGIANRGGVGTQQAANQLANVYQQLLTNQMNQGLQIAGIGDAYQIQAIKTGLQFDQQSQQSIQNLLSTLAAVSFGVPSYRTTAPATSGNI